MGYGIRYGRSPSELLSRTHCAVSGWLRSESGRPGGGATLRTGLSKEVRVGLGSEEYVRGDAGECVEWIGVGEKGVH